MEPTTTMQPSAHDNVQSGNEEGWTLDDNAKRELAYPGTSDGCSPAKDVDDDGRPKRTGAFWRTLSLLVTARVGTGVLSLAWSMAKLGWVVGIATILLFGLITYITSDLLANSYRSPPSQKRNYTYKEAVRSILGVKHAKFCSLWQYVFLVGVTIGYMVTSSVSMMNIARTMCFQKNREVSQCDTPISTFMIIFGGAQVALSQIPTFSKTWWLSILASTMTMTYCSLGVVLGMKKIIHEGVNLEHGSGERFFSDKKLSFDTLWPIFQAIGNIALGYTCIILIEIQDTIKYPFEVITMKKANTTGVSITTCLYVFIACMGYGAFGSDAPGNLLEGFSFIDTYWLIGFANFCVILQLVGACQVYAQVIFAITEEWILGHFPKSKLLHKSFSITLWNGRHALNFNLFLLLWRTTYVVSLTIVSILLPFFTSILGVLGALGFWPLTVYFPVEMHLTQSKAQRWTKTWIIFEGVSMFCFFVSILALVGSIAGIIDSLKV